MRDGEPLSSRCCLSAHAALSHGSYETKNALSSAFVLIALVYFPYVQTQELLIILCRRLSSSVVGFIRAAATAPAESAESLFALLQQVRAIEKSNA